MAQARLNGPLRSPQELATIVKMPSQNSWEHSSLCIVGPNPLKIGERVVLFDQCKALDSQGVVISVFDGGHVTMPNCPTGMYIFKGDEGEVVATCGHRELRFQEEVSFDLVVKGMQCIFALHFTLAGQRCTTPFRPLQRDQNHR